MDDKEINSREENKKSPSGCLKILGIAAVIAVVVALISALWVKQNIYASDFRPAKLNAQEQEQLDSKLSRLEESARNDRSLSHGRLTPEPYSEEGARREISFSEKELNSIIAHDPETARRVAIDLSEDLLSVKLVVPLHDDVAVVGGTTLKITMGLILRYENDRPVVALKGISIGGIPMPNAWLGYIKNKNLVDEFGSEQGFWKLFSEGVRDISVKEGHIRIRLKS
jgi:hypothetical protein